MWSFILYALLAWFLYNLIFRFIVPVYKASKQMKKGFREMQERMQEQMRQQQPQSTESQHSKPESQKPVGDYIDFEEIKE